MVVVISSNSMRLFKRVLAWLLGTAVVLFTIALLVLRMPVFGGTIDGAHRERIQASPQFVGGRFENTPPQEPFDFGKLRTMVKNYTSGGQVREPQFEIPVVKLSDADFNEAVPGLHLFWFGHSSVLIEINGMRIMTDPVFSEFASPFDFIGPRRLHPPPLALKDMPTIDAVLISHDHYDHLDMHAIKHFADAGTRFYVGLGIGSHLERWGVADTQIHEMDWWESLPLNTITIYCTPARHYSGRRDADNSTLWSSWVVKGEHRSLYYSGDTGYTSHFSTIRERLGPIDLSIMKIGAYGDSWLDIHMDPESAMQAHLDVGADVFYPVHWATFNLAYHAWDEPIERTLSVAADNGVKVVTPRVGERYDFDIPFSSRLWWVTSKANR